LSCDAEKNDSAPSDVYMDRQNDFRSDESHNAPRVDWLSAAALAFAFARLGRAQQVAIGAVKNRIGA
jgi:hypothetical protein